MAQGGYGSGSKEEMSPGVWRLRIYVGKDPLTGRKRQVEKRFHGNKTEATKALRKMASAHDEGRLDPTTATFGEVLERWLTHKSPTLKATTMREHRRAVKTSIAPALGSIRLSKLSPHDIDLYMRAELKRGLGAGSVRRRFAIINAALNQAVKWEWVGRNPALQATQPKAPEEIELVLPTPYQLNALYLAALAYDTPMGNMLACAVGIGGFFGNRRGEANSMRWNDVDQARRELKAYRSRSVVDGTVFEDDTKTHSRRDLAMDEFAAQMLARRVDYQRSVAQAAGVEMVANPYFLSLRADGAQPVHPDTISHQWHDLCNGYWRYHDLRHWMGTMLTDAGASQKTVQKRLGHKSSRTTERYQHAVEGRDREAAAMIGSLIQLPALDADFAVVAAEV